MLRSKDEGNFSCKDISVMKMIGPFISKLAANYMIVSDLRNQQCLFESFCDQSPIGLIVFEAHDPRRIHYINSAAWRCISELPLDSSKYNQAEQFIKQYIINDSCFEQIGSSKTVFSRTLRRYAVDAVPYRISDSKTFIVYVYIVPQSESEGIKKYRFFQSNPNLTARQQEIIDCVLHGYTNEEIAKKLFISVSTVKTHLNNIYKELNVTNRLGLYSKLVGDNGPE